LTKILLDLREDGEIISGKTVAKVMRSLGLKGVRPERWKTTTITNTTDTYPVDVVQRKWDVGALHQVWVDDISYLRTLEEWRYLATVIDAHSRRVIGWAIDEHLRSALVEDALRMAITLRGELPEKVEFHTDRTRNTPRAGSPRSQMRTGSPARWATPRCAGVTRSPNRFSPP
jgi:putative transposase